MKLTRLQIENFRSIKHLTLELGATTVLIGPNNAGKTAILDAIRIALTRRWGQRGTGFTEYDVHLPNDSADPKASPGVAIEITAEESTAGEWPEEVHQVLDQIVQVHPATGRGSITMRVTCAWSATDASFQPSWAFLNVARQPLVSASARRVNLERFWEYVPVFYLGALRDVGDEFSSRSQFWGRLLRAMRIPSDLEGRVQRILEVVNRKLLDADPRLTQIAATLSGATQVSARDREGGVSLRLLPLKSWDLLSKAEIVLRNEPDWPWLPLQRHGQGIQSLSVIFLFQAFVEHLLTEIYHPASTPLLALEEPETHLHPQAARALWRNVNALPGQKIITTHSPYFVQRVPFRDLRLVRLTERGTEISSLPASFAASLPHVPALDSVVAGSSGILTYEVASETLTVYGALDEATYRRLLACYGTHPQRTAAEGLLRGLKDRSATFISDDELKSLETFARRIRGEIFFARRWMIVEGQAEYHLVQAMARRLAYDLDENGVSVIDAMNNGHPAHFAVLARALGIPWCAVFDGDEAGVSYTNAIKNRGFDAEALALRCRTLASQTLEDQLLADGCEAELRKALADLGHQDALTIDMTALKQRLNVHKAAVAARLADDVAHGRIPLDRLPKVFLESIERLKALQ